MTYIQPDISHQNASTLPPPPEGWKYAITDGSLLSYPILLFGSVTYTAVSKINGDLCLKIVGFDPQRNLVKELDKSGTRYIGRIEFDPRSQTVTFITENHIPVQFTLDELAVRPSVVLLPSSLGPILPYTLAYGAPNLDKFPVIKCGAYSFWPVTYKDGRNTLSVVVTDQNNDILQLIDCPGTQLIGNIQVNDAKRSITLVGWDGSTANLDYDTAMACYHRQYTFTKDDFQFLAQYFQVSLPDSDLTSMEQDMPEMNCSDCCPMKDVVVPKERTARASSTDTVWVGDILGEVIGALSGFLLGGTSGIRPGFFRGISAGDNTKTTIRSSRESGVYPLSYWEKESSLVGYNQFPCGPFDSKGDMESIFNLPFLRYGSRDLLYCAAVTKYSTTPPLQAYIPAQGYIGTFPRDPRYIPLKLRNGIEVTKYTFVIVKTEDNVRRDPGYQMRIIHEDFLPDAWLTAPRVNHSQISSAYNFWALVGNYHVEAYAAGNLFVDITNRKILGIDTRLAHFYRSFGGQDEAVNKAAIGFLTNLGYPTSDMLYNADILGYFLENSTEKPTENSVSS